MRGQQVLHALHVNTICFILICGNMFKPVDKLTLSVQCIVNIMHIKNLYLQRNVSCSLRDRNNAACSLSNGCIAIIDVFVSCVRCLVQMWLACCRRVISAG